MRRLHLAVTITLLLSATSSFAQAPPPPAPEIAAGIDAAVKKVLDETGVPGASVAVVRDGAIALAKAYGRARLEPPTPAAPGMRYPIGSISKQFTAASVVMLAAEGKLSLDDRVAKFLPDLTRAGDITLRQILSHTAGIRDFWPQDYVPASMLEPITPDALMGRWARQPLDFEPGSKYQYSNTGYVIAGAIVEKVGGRPLMEFQRERIFGPLGMDSVVDFDQGGLTGGDAAGYVRYALGPLRPAPAEGKGWMFAAGHLAMTAADLARWDAAFIDGTVPGPAVTRALAQEVVLTSGAGSGYGLGVGIELKGDRRVISHGGEVSGFTAENRVYPEDRAAIVVLTNQDAVDAASTIADKIAELIFVSASPADAQMLARVTGILEGLRKGRIDRSLFTSNANAYFSEQALKDISTGLKRLGAVKEIKPVRQGLRGGFVTRVYRAVLARKTLRIVTRALPDGTIEQYMLSVE
jgi:D-alanyl-D-alanine carboxypeptidase